MPSEAAAASRAQRDRPRRFSLQVIMMSRIFSVSPQPPDGGLSS
jgi:hypothetical protein